MGFAIAGAALLALALLTVYMSYKAVFGRAATKRAHSKRAAQKRLFSVPDEMRRRIDEAAALPYEAVHTTSHDGLKLAARYYHNADNAPVEVFFHGYRGSPCGDGYGHLAICRQLGINALMVDQRSHDNSEGSALSLGINEKLDCAAWARYCVERFGDDVKLALVGMSMGAGTVLMASDLELPRNVKGIVADCGYTSPRDIVRHVLRAMKLPVGLAYFALSCGARLFGGFDLNGSGAIDALARTQLPVLLLHGERDEFVPCSMSVENYNAAASRKSLLIVPEARHCGSFLADEPAYTRAVSAFMDSIFERR
ncbi:MAG: alpha/beta hydrolase [Clostridia bacterium]|nr:alpha/beta hydrolase [Clostridia bacterium]